MPNLQPTDNGNKPNPLLLPEIACGINKYIYDKQDSLSLAVTCRSLFYSIMPVHWKTLGGIENLLRLIPGTMIKRESYILESGERWKVIITIPESALTSSWERYWLYAPFIQGLYMHVFESIVLDGWNILFAKRNETGGSLLPNLVRLDTISEPINQLAWFRLFLSPSLRVLTLQDYVAISVEIDTDSSYKSVSSANLDSELNATSDSQTQLLLESQYTTTSLGYGAPAIQRTGPPGSLVRKERLSWVDYLPMLTNLTYVHIYSDNAPAGSGEALIILGHLPHLERLGMHGDFESQSRSSVLIQEEPLPIPSDLFPRLKTLHLLSMPGTRLFYYIWNSEAMVSKLTSARVRFGSNPASVTRNELAFKIIPVLCKYSPNLTKLDISVAFKDGLSDSESSASEMLFQLLSRLPLSSLSFDIGPEKIEGDWTVCRRTVFPLLQWLDLSPLLLPNQLRALVLLFPNLRYLNACPNLGKTQSAGAYAFESSESASPIKPVSAYIYVGNEIDHKDFKSHFFIERFPELTRWGLQVVVAD
ncbi:unnamed protein product [Rhizoctonia solani]|uniref:Uncharacterized protein n=1 Tax=Rhizoctonia solani TaxID=456999 RepID=A0A8H3CR74_9AGAM|nr:unnamed protein product [Rhizoctonia solani]